MVGGGGVAITLTNPNSVCKDITAEWKMRKNEKKNKKVSPKRKNDLKVHLGLHIFKYFNPAAMAIWSNHSSAFVYLYAYFILIFHKFFCMLELLEMQIIDVDAEL